ncbi:MAG: DUF2807 domain-containing protein [Defluviitaleaceae bacterium]|nr:DUF2807 domain-containing protein [Defluviitaleaceae bacterium]
MYDFNGFGQRVQKLRKAKGMTQEELADRVGVTGQAVSKWENDQSYPDITLIPTLAGILSTEIDFLFGKAPATPASNDTLTYPETFEGLLLVHSAAGVACYSNKDVTSKDASGIKFSDGSLAELSNRLVVNNGPGEIRFVGAEEMGGDTWQYFDSSATTKDFEFGETSSVNIEILFNECCIVRSSDGKTRVRAKGDARLINRLRVEAPDGMLKIYFQQQNCDSFNRGSYKENQVIVEVPYEQGSHACICINGSGTLNSETLRFDTGNLTVNGSGDICMGDFNSCDAKVNGSGNISIGSSDELKLSINGSGAAEIAAVKNANVSVNGSGDITLKSAADLKSTINGSGDLTVDELLGGDVKIRIMGSGDVEINGGNCQKFDADIIGSGDVDASALTARTAHIVLHQSGNVTLGRVLETTTEQIKKKGTIKILKRGAEN